MPADARTYLWHVQEAAEAIERFVSGLSLQAYVDSDLIHSAVERKFGVIGEALAQLARLDPVLAESIAELRDIVAFRNLLIHGYAVVEHERVFAIVAVSLPALRAQVSALLGELGPPPA